MPDSKPQPAALLSQNIEYELAEINVISGRAVVKGNVRLKLCYASDGADYPVTAEFSSRFRSLSTCRTPIPPAARRGSR